LSGFFTFAMDDNTEDNGEDNDQQEDTPHGYVGHHGMVQGHADLFCCACCQDP
jgi:hypothetical protein